MKEFKRLLKPFVCLMKMFARLAQDVSGGY